VKKRTELDLNKLNEADLSLEETMVWIRELFLGKGTEKFRITEEILDFGFGVIEANYKAAKSPLSRQLIRRKALHTREVVVAGIEILEEEGSVNWDPYMAGAVTFLHDIGRFPQAHLESMSDRKTGFDHASVGADMIAAKKFEESTEMGLDMKRVEHAVREHSRISYNGSDEYAKYIRDADKLGLLEYIRYYLDEFVGPNGKASKGAVEAFVEGRLVSHEYMINRVDLFLAWLSWIHDFNFDATSELFLKSGVAEYMLEEIRKMDEDAFEVVEKKIMEMQ